MIGMSLPVFMFEKPAIGICDSLHASKVNTASNMASDRLCDSRFLIVQLSRNARNQRK